MMSSRIQPFAWIIIWIATIVCASNIREYMDIKTLSNNLLVYSQYVYASKQFFETMNVFFNHSDWL